MSRSYSHWQEQGLISRLHLRARFMPEALRNAGRSFKNVNSVRAFAHAWRGHIIHILDLTSLILSRLIVRRRLWKYLVKSEKHPRYPPSHIRRVTARSFATVIPAILELPSHKRPAIGII